MPRGISVMVILHVLMIVYLSVGLAAQIKVRYNVGADTMDAPPIFGRTVRDYAPVLFVLPVGWAALALRRWHRDGNDLLQSSMMMFTGFTIVAVLFVIGFMGTVSIWSQGSLVKAIL